MINVDRVILAYSGGLDTSIAIPWIKEQFGMDVITLTLELGQGRDLEQVREKALKSGAIGAHIADVRKEFVAGFVWPALRAGALYEGKYPLATALSRPLIARELADLATSERATAVAHGCTGKGNDQVRLELGIVALAPNLKVIAPARQWGLSREDELEYAKVRGIPTPVSVDNPYSVDENLWGRSIEAGKLEDPLFEPPEDIYEWTKSVTDAPHDPTYVEIELRAGVPSAINGKLMEGIPIIEYLNDLAGTNGIGRIDHLENRLVGIKSREIYEAPAAVVLNICHRALEELTLTKDQHRFKEGVSIHYADLVYNGLWFSKHREDLDQYVLSSQRFVTGMVRVKLHKGVCTVVGRSSPYSLYSYEQATYDKSDQFDHRASEGFIKIYGLPIGTQARYQPPSSSI
jgi:argininosuccinate synthase